ncbi:hypothetical protein BO78DRAFT_274513, partial [Aspergillus sclerotiicarbonarius CBS 121057]
EDPRRALHSPAIKSRDENTWLNSHDTSKEEFLDFRSIQNTYKVQLNEFPNSGYSFRIWLLWDYDRIWGKFDFGYTKGMFLVDPGPKMPKYDDDDGYKSQTLPFCWRGVRKTEPDYLLCNELIMKGKICINQWEHTLEGVFEYMTGNSNAGEGSCAFHAKAHFGPSVVPYCLEDIVEEWNVYSSLPVPEDRVRQYLCAWDLQVDLRRRDKKK